MHELQQNLPVRQTRIEQHHKTYLHKLANTDQVYINSRAIIYSHTNNAPVRSNFPEAFDKKVNSKDEGQIATANFISLKDFLKAINDTQAELIETTARTPSSLAIAIIFY
ncbi:MAG: hypothetical protein PVI21_01870 [Candidatus Woesebacteria bacterium]|jgi:hypothetical protein